MTTNERLNALAEHLRTQTGHSVYASPDLSAGRGDVWLYLGPPTFTFDDAAQALCRPGRDPRLAVSVVVVGPGTAPGQLAALFDAADAVVDAIGQLQGWMPTTDGSAFEYQGTPAYEFPIITT